MEMPEGSVPVVKFLSQYRRLIIGGRISIVTPARNPHFPRDNSSSFPYN
jgi:hypothetical protein